MTVAPEAHPDWVKVENLKTRAVEVAAGLVASRGPDGVNVRDIAEVLHTGPSSLYHYFKSKDALLAEVAADGFRSLEAKVKAALVERPDATILACGGAYLRFIRENPMRYRVMYAERILAGYDVAQAAEHQARDTFVRCIATGTGSGESEDGALALWAFGRGIAALAIASEAGEPGSGRELTRKLVDGLEALMGRQIRPHAED